MDLKQDMVQQAVADCHQGRVGGGELSRAIPPEPSGPPADAAECRLVELNVRELSFPVEVCA